MHGWFTADLAKIILDATEAPAGAFKARGIPDVLRAIEILGILQSRSWGTCSVSIIIVCHGRGGSSADVGFIS